MTDPLRPNATSDEGSADKAGGMDNYVQVGWLVKYRSENNDPESEFFGTTTEWWDTYVDVHSTPPEGARPIYVSSDDFGRAGVPDA